VISKIVVTPNVFNENNNMSHINSLIKDTISNPIFFVNYDGVDWFNIVNEKYISKLEQRYKTKLQQLLKLLKNKHRIIIQSNQGIKITRSAHWMEISKKAIVKKLIDFVITDDESSKKNKAYLADKCESINDIIFENTLWDDLKEQRSKVLIKSLQEYRKLFESFMPYTSKLTIIDAYIEYSTKYENFIKLCSELLGNINGLQKRKSKIVIHTSFNRDKNRNLKKFLQNLNTTYGHDYKINFWEDHNGDGNKIHDRFLITESLGIMMGHSTDVSITSNQQTTLTVIDEKTKQIHLDQYDEDDPLYKLNKTITSQ